MAAKALGQLGFLGDSTHQTYSGHSSGVVSRNSWNACVRYLHDERYDAGRSASTCTQRSTEDERGERNVCHTRSEYSVRPSVCTVCCRSSSNCHSVQCKTAPLTRTGCVRLCVLCVCVCVCSRRALRSHNVTYDSTMKLICRVIHELIYVIN